MGKILDFFRYPFNDADNDRRDGRSVILIIVRIILIIAMVVILICVIRDYEAPLNTDIDERTSIEYPREFAESWRGKL